MSLGDAPDRRSLRALSHPVRLRIMSMLIGTPMSSAELARELGMNHAAVSFHVRQLAAADYLELVETRSVRGGQERRYRTKLAGREQWQREDPQLTVRAAAEEVTRRLAAGPAHWRLFGDAELWVDAGVWDDVVGRIVAAVSDLDKAAMPPHTPGTMHVSATAMLFALEGDHNETGGQPEDRQ